MNPEELEKLYEIFNVMDQEQTGYITRENFESGLGSIMNDKVLAGALFSLIKGKDDEDRITFPCFAESMVVLMKGDGLSQIQCILLQSPQFGVFA